MKSLETLEMPIGLRKWIFNWLQERRMSVSQGEARSRSFHVRVGAPQGSVLAALLFRLHIHFLPLHFPQIDCHLFVDDLTMIIKAGLEFKLSVNVRYLEAQAETALKSLARSSDDHLPPVNESKTKAMLIHSAVSVQKAKVKYNDNDIEFVPLFECLGVEIGTKLGMGENIDTRLRKVRSSYRALRLICRPVPKSETKIRRNLFCAFSLPHFSWLFSTCFYYTEKQRQKDRTCLRNGPAHRLLTRGPRRPNKPHPM